MPDLDSQPALVDAIARVLSHLRSMSEPELHREIILPILQRMATHVRYVHGASERGKDFVYVTRDAYGDSVLEVCQVKNGPFSGRAGTKRNTASLLDQLRQSRNYEVLNPETNRKERPQVVSLWTTYPISDRDTADGAGLLNELSAMRCKIVTPEKLVSLLKQYAGSLYDDIAYPGHGIVRELMRYLDRHHESPAFDLSTEKMLTAFFVNIGIATASAVGRVRKRRKVSGESVPEQFGRSIRSLQVAINELCQVCQILPAEVDIRKIREIDSDRAKSFFGQLCAEIDVLLSKNTEESLTVALRVMVLAQDMIDRLCSMGSLVPEISHVSNALVMDEITPKLLLRLDESIVVTGDAGAGKTSLARMVALEALESGIACVYLPCSRIRRESDDIQGTAIRFLSELVTEGDEREIRRYVESADLWVLDGLDEAVTFGSRLGSQVNNIVAAGGCDVLIGQKMTRKNLGRVGSEQVVFEVPADLSMFANFNGASGVVSLVGGMRRLDVDRIAQVNRSRVGRSAKTDRLRQEFAKHVPRVIVTSRTAEPLGLARAFVRFELRPLTNGQLRELLLNWNNSEGDVQRIMDHLAGNDRLLDVCRRPLVATLLATLCASGYEPPESKTELYERRADLLLDRWDLVRGVRRRNRVRARDKRTLLIRLALELHVAHRRTFSMDDVRVLWNDGFSRLYVNVEPEEVVAELILSHSLVEAHGNDVYSLGHLSYQEFFAAQGIVFGGYQELLANEFHDSWWSEVALFYAGLCGDVSGFIGLLQRKCRLSEDDERLVPLVDEARLTSPVVADFLRDAVDLNEEWADE